VQDIKKVQWINEIGVIKQNSRNCWTVEPNWCAGYSACMLLVLCTVMRQMGLHRAKS